MYNYKKSTTAPASPEDCRWAVCYDIDGKNYDDRKPRTCISAVFTYPFQAEAFISNCAAPDRFYIVHI